MFSIPSDNLRVGLDGENALKYVTNANGYMPIPQSNCLEW